jgi:hypothetical protein
MRLDGGCEGEGDRLGLPAGVALPELLDDLGTLSFEHPDWDAPIGDGIRQLADAGEDLRTRRPERTGPRACYRS